MGEWQPIETAPKDGRDLLLYPSVFVGVPVHVGKFYGGAWRMQHLAMGRDPTHWMPLPDPPSPTALENADG